MDLKDKYLSLQLYNYLCNIVGSEEVVRTRREIFAAKAIVRSSANTTFISSGSKAEGLDLKGSDYDEMILYNCIHVYESLNDVQFDPDTLPLVMDTNDTKPGFTKLKLVNKSYLAIDSIQDWCETTGEETYVSSKGFREHPAYDGMIIHGPCHSTPNGDYDQAKCFRCMEWILPAQQWIHRSRTTWPHHTSVTAAVQYGVLFVPIGCKHSPNEDIQWRMSFSVTEKLLIHSFTHTQLLCYALLKIILTDLIKPRHGDVLCSYFLKTIIFWLSEEINPSGWKPENMIPCFLECLRRLIYCVEYNTCLHYFIPENNLFEDRFFDKEHNSLLDDLRLIFKSPLISVFETSTCQNYRLQSVNSRGMVLSASELSCYYYLFMPRVSSIDNVIKRLVNVGVKKELSTYTLSVYATELLRSFHLFNMKARNKEFYQQYNRSLCFFKISLRLFSISAWLLLASLFYKCKRFQECVVIIHYCLSKCSRDMIHLDFKNSLVEQTIFKERKQRCKFLLAIKHLVIGDVYFEFPFFFLPDELMPAQVGKLCWFPPVVYSYLLQFLCCYHLGDNIAKYNALRDLELTIKERYFILDNVLNLGMVHESLDIVKRLL